jgi:hypothetical protein
MRSMIETWGRWLPLALALAEVPLVLAAEETRLAGALWALGEAPPAGVAAAGPQPVGQWPAARGSLSVDAALDEADARRVAWPVLLGALGMVGALWPTRRRG